MLFSAQEGVGVDGESISGSSSDECDTSVGLCKSRRVVRFAFGPRRRYERLRSLVYAVLSRVGVSSSPSINVDEYSNEMSRVFEMDFRDTDFVALDFRDDLASGTGRYFRNADSNSTDLGFFESMAY